MFFNPLFLQVTNSEQSASQLKMQKMNGSSYLFSDIIKVCFDKENISEAALTQSVKNSNTVNLSGFIEKLFNDKINLQELSSSPELIPGNAENPISKSPVHFNKNEVHEFISNLLNAGSKFKGKISLVIDETQLFENGTIETLKQSPGSLINVLKEGGTLLIEDPDLVKENGLLITIVEEGEESAEAYKTEQNETTGTLLNKPVITENEYGNKPELPESEYGITLSLINLSKEYSGPDIYHEVNPGRKLSILLNNPPENFYSSTGLSANDISVFTTMADNTYRRSPGLNNPIPFISTQASFNSTQDEGNVSIPDLITKGTESQEFNTPQNPELSASANAENANTNVNSFEISKDAFAKLKADGNSSSTVTLSNGNAAQQNRITGTNVNIQSNEVEQGYSLSTGQIKATDQNLAGLKKVSSDQPEVISSPEASINQKSSGNNNVIEDVTAGPKTPERTFSEKNIENKTSEVKTLNPDTENLKQDVNTNEIKKTNLKIDIINPDLNSKGKSSGEQIFVVPDKKIRIIRQGKPETANTSGVKEPVSGMKPKDPAAEAVKQNAIVDNENIEKNSTFKEAAEQISSEKKKINLPNSKSSVSDQSFKSGSIIENTSGSIKNTKVVQENQPSEITSETGSKPLNSTEKIKIFEVKIPVQSTSSSGIENNIPGKQQQDKFFIGSDQDFKVKVKASQEVNQLHNANASLTDKQEAKKNVVIDDTQIRINSGGLPTVKNKESKVEIKPDELPVIKNIDEEEKTVTINRINFGNKPHHEVLSNTQPIKSKSQNPGGVQERVSKSEDKGFQEIPAINTEEITNPKSMKEVISKGIKEINTGTSAGTIEKNITEQVQPAVVKEEITEPVKSRPISRNETDQKIDAGNKTQQNNNGNLENQGKSYSEESGKSETGLQGSQRTSKSGFTKELSDTNPLPDKAQMPVGENQITVSERPNITVKERNKDSKESAKFDNEIPVEKKSQSDPVLRSESQIFSKEKVSTDIPFQHNPARIIKAAEIVKEMSKFIQEGNKNSIVLKLDPEHLGAMKIQLEVVNKMVNAQIEVDNEATQKLVESHLPQLYNTLSQNGVQVNMLNISLNNFDQRNTKNLFTRKKSSGVENERIADDKSTIQEKNMGYNTYEYLI